MIENDFKIDISNVSDTYKRHFIKKEIINKKYVYPKSYDISFKNSMFVKKLLIKYLNDNSGNLWKIDHDLVKHNAHDNGFIPFNISFINNYITQVVDETNNGEIETYTIRFDTYGIDISSTMSDIDTYYKSNYLDINTELMNKNVSILTTTPDSYAKIEYYTTTDVVIDYIDEIFKFNSIKHPHGLTYEDVISHETETSEKSWEECNTFILRKISEVSGNNILSVKVDISNTLQSMLNDNDIYQYLPLNMYADISRTPIDFFDFIDNVDENHLDNLQIKSSFQDIDFNNYTYLFDTTSDNTLISNILVDISDNSKYSLLDNSSNLVVSDITNNINIVSWDYIPTKISLEYDQSTNQITNDDISFNTRKRLTKIFYGSIENKDTIYNISNWETDFSNNYVVDPNNYLTSLKNLLTLNYEDILSIKTKYYNENVPNKLPHDVSGGIYDLSELYNLQLNEEFINDIIYRYIVHKNNRIKTKIIPPTNTDQSIYYYVYLPSESNKKTNLGVNKYSELLLKSDIDLSRHPFNKDDNEPRGAFFYMNINDIPGDTVDKIVQNITNNYLINTNHYIITNYINHVSSLLSANNLKPSYIDVSDNIKEITRNPISEKTYKHIIISDPISNEFMELYYHQNSLDEYISYGVRYDYKSKLILKDTIEKNISSYYLIKNQINVFKRLKSTYYVNWIDIDANNYETYITFANIIDDYANRPNVIPNPILDWKYNNRTNTDGFYTGVNYNNLRILKHYPPNISVDTLHLRNESINQNQIVPIKSQDILNYNSRHLQYKNGNYSLFELSNDITHELFLKTVNDKVYETTDINNNEKRYRIEDYQLTNFDASGLVDEFLKYNTTIYNKRIYPVKKDEEGNYTIKQTEYSKRFFYNYYSRYLYQDNFFDDEPENYTKAYIEESSRLIKKKIITNIKQNYTFFETNIDVGATNNIIYKIDNIDHVNHDNNHYVDVQSNKNEIYHIKHSNYSIKHLKNIDISNLLLDEFINTVDLNDLFENEEISKNIETLIYNYVNLFIDTNKQKKTAQSYNLKKNYTSIKYYDEQLFKQAFFIYHSYYYHNIGDNINHVNTYNNFMKYDDILNTIKEPKHANIKKYVHEYKKMLGKIFLNSNHVIEYNNPDNNEDKNDVNSIININVLQSVINKIVNIEKHRIVEDSIKKKLTDLSDNLYHLPESEFVFINNKIKNTLQFYKKGVNPVSHFSIKLKDFENYIIDIPIEQINIKITNYKIIWDLDGYVYTDDDT